MSMLENMRITLLRNATLVVEGAEQRLVVDPSLAPPRRWPPLSLIRSQPALNPTVPLPEGSREQLAAITGALVTHFRFGHADHLDSEGKLTLLQVADFNAGPVQAGALDGAQPLSRWRRVTFPWSSRPRSKTSLRFQAISNRSKPS